MVMVVIADSGWGDFVGMTLRQISHSIPRELLPHTSPLAMGLPWFAGESPLVCAACWQFPGSSAGVASIKSLLAFLPPARRH